MIEVALIGAGGRGNVYSSYALKRPNELRIAAVADPDEERRTRFAQKYDIPPERCYASWEEMLEEPKFCRAVFICTQDRDHYLPAMKAIEAGYDILLEKPMAADPYESLHIAEAAKEKGTILTVCHSMRYGPFNRKLKQLIDTHAIGKVMTVQWTENVGYWHHAHSFVRGNWRNTETSSPMILAKSCHDLDMLQWLVGQECEKVSSFGDLSYFKEENAPEGSTARCTDGCEVEGSCPYSAIKWYYNEKNSWPHNYITHEATLEARWKAITEGPYGRCVYRCDNDVVDHQVVNMQFADGATVAFTMTAFSEHETRSIKIMGTEGEIRALGMKNEIEIQRFGGERQVVYPERIEGGHGGADTVIVRDFVRQLQADDKEGYSSGMVSAMNHLIAFAAEESRLSGQTVEMKDYVAKVKQSENGMRGR